MVETNSACFSLHYRKIGLYDWWSGLGGRTGPALLQLWWRAWINWRQWARNGEQSSLLPFCLPINSSCLATVLEDYRLHPHLHSTSTQNSNVWKTQAQTKTAKSLIAPAGVWTMSRQRGWRFINMAELSTTHSLLRLFILQTMRANMWLVGCNSLCS